MGVGDGGSGWGWDGEVEGSEEVKGSEGVGEEEERVLESLGGVKNWNRVSLDVNEGSTDYINK